MVDDDNKNLPTTETKRNGISMHTRNSRIMYTVN